MSNANTNVGHAVQNPSVVGGATSLDQSGVVFISATLGNYANDAAAASGGVPVGGLYRNGSVLMIRVA